MRTIKKATCLVSCLSVVGLACADSVTAPSPAGPASMHATAVTVTGRIVYTARGKLHIYNVATRADVNLGVAGVNPKFSPDGMLITFQQDGIGVMSSDGSGRRTLSATGGTPSFDPTGTMIAFGDNGIVKINVDGQGLTRITSDGGRHPTWSPNGSQIAYSGPGASAMQLFIVNVDGTNRHQALTSAGIIDPVWNPSARIVFGLLAVKNNYELYSYDPTNTASLTRLTTTKGNDFEPSWSPDGSAISWTSGAGGIWLMNADGTGKQGPVIPGGRQGSWGR